MILALTLFLIAIGNQYVTIQESRTRGQLQDVADMLETELSVAATAQGGYYRMFYVPQKAGGLDYYVRFVDAVALGSPGNPANYTEVDLGLVNSSVKYETYFFLPENVIGTLGKGAVELKKRRGVLNMTALDSPPPLPPGCTCDPSWTNGACGAGGCISPTPRQQTRICTPAGCGIEMQCVEDNGCGPFP